MGTMAMARGRFAASATASPGITLLVPRPIVDAEQNELMHLITLARVQNLIIFLKRGGIRHLDINERLLRGEYKGLTPLHVAVLCGTSSVVAAILELGGASPHATAAKTLETPLHLAARRGDVGMTKALVRFGARIDALDHNRLSPLLVAAGSATSRASFHHLVASELVKVLPCTPPVLCPAHASPNPSRQRNSLSRKRSRTRVPPTYRVLRRAPHWWYAIVTETRRCTSPRTRCSRYPSYRKY